MVVFAPSAETALDAASRLQGALTAAENRATETTDLGAARAVELAAARESHREAMLNARQSLLALGLLAVGCAFHPPAPP